MNQEETVEFIYDKTTKKPERLQNNVFILYTPEKIRLQPGEMMSVNMKVKIKFSTNIVGTCILQLWFEINELKHDCTRN